MVDSERNQFIDILKGICILFVIVTHFNWSDAERSKFLFPFWIDMAVPIFMIISGYLNAKSYKKRNVFSWNKMFSFRDTIAKMIRFTIPFLVIFVVLEVFYILTTSKIDIFSILFRFLNGGFGPGAYYYPILMQFIFIFPIIYMMILRYDFKGLLICGGVNALYELLQQAYGMNYDFYRVLVLRYIFVIAFGCYLAVGQKKINWKKYLVSFCIGTLFLIVVCYLGYSPKILVYWPQTSFVATLYVVPICAFLLSNVDISFKPLEIIGKASYNIFLVQMAYYIKADLVYSICPNRFVALIVSIAICSTAGILFYYIEAPVTRKIIQRSSKLNVL